MSQSQPVVLIFVITISLITIGLLTTDYTYSQETGTYTKWGKYGSGNGTFNQPSSIAIAPSGNILVADTGNNRIQVLSQNGTFISTLGEYGKGDEQLRLPSDIAVTQTGEIIVADKTNNRIASFKVDY